MTVHRRWTTLSGSAIQAIPPIARQKRCARFRRISTSSPIGEPTSSFYPPPEPLSTSTRSSSSDFPPLALPNFTAPPSAFSTFGCDAELLSHFLSLPPRPLTFNALISLGRGPQLKNSLNSTRNYVPSHSPPNILQSASFTRRELPIRLARRVGAFRNLPFIVGSNPYVQKIARLYAESFETLARFEEIKDEESNNRYTAMLERLVSDHAQNVPTLARGFLECKKYMAPRDVSAFLDATIHSRIGIRLIAEQHLSLSSSASFSSPSSSDKSSSSSSKESSRDSHAPHTLTDPSSVGVLSLNLSASSLIKTCANFVSDLCEGTLGQAPELWLEGDVDATYVGVPVHLEYVMTEVLKNSYRATAERWGEKKNSKSKDRRSQFGSKSDTKDMPPVKVTIAKSKNHLSIRVRDQGGGISPKNLPHVFSYAFTTAASEDQVADSDSSSPNDEYGPYSMQSNAGMGEDEDALGLLGGGGQNGLSSGLGTLAGLGYGLPMARIYATYFGAGSRLEVVSLWGHGCDTFIKLPANVLTIE